MDDLRPSTDQKVGDSSSSGRATDQGFCTDVKCPNRTRNCPIVKCRQPSPREIQAGQHFPGFLPPRTHDAPTDPLSGPSGLPIRAQLSCSRPGLLPSIGI